MQSADALPLPSRVGRYRILGPLGVGGMASVYLAVSEGAAGFRREVALKMLHPHLLSDEHLVQQFLTEARVAAKITHPNVVPVTDVVHERSWAYLVMEFVEGASLAELKRVARSAGAPIPTQIWARWFTESLAGLHAAHELKDERGVELGLVHRDFSPQNILIARSGIARLSDFGVVKLTSGDHRTQSGVVKGKVNYMSPEQVRGDALDRRCDVFAAGVVAWELATGRRMRKHKDDVQTLLEIVSGDPPRASSIVPGLSRELDDLIAWALVSDPASRCPSAAKLRSGILDALGPGGVADADETSAWLERNASELLNGRREKLLAARSLRDRLDSLFEEKDSVETTTPHTSEAPPDVHEAPTQFAPVLTQPPAETKEKSRPLRWVVFAAIGVAAVVLTAIGLSRRTLPQEREAPTPASVDSVVLAPPASVPSESPRRLVADGNEPIASISIDGREVALSKAATHVELDLPDFAVGRQELKLDARSRGGASASVLWSDGRPVRFEFPAASGTKPPPRPASTKPSKLAKNPYGD